MPTLGAPELIILGLMCAVPLAVVAIAASIAVVEIQKRRRDAP